MSPVVVAYPTGTNDCISKTNKKESFNPQFCVVKNREGRQTSQIGPPSISRSSFLIFWFFFVFVCQSGHWNPHQSNRLSVPWDDLYSNFFLYLYFCFSLSFYLSFCLSLSLSHFLSSIFVYYVFLSPLGYFCLSVSIHLSIFSIFLTRNVYLTSFLSLINFFLKNIVPSVLYFRNFLLSSTCTS